VSLGHRTRSVLLAVTIFAPLAGGGLWWWIGTSSDAPAQAEAEPNDDAATATPLSWGRPMLASLATRDGVTVDVDVYRLPAIEGGKVLRLDVSAAGGVDLVLEIRDEHGTVVAGADNSGAAFSELIPNLRLLATGPHFAVVRAVAGPAAPGDVAEYRVHAALRLASGRHDESEPNDDVASATRILAGLPTVAFSGTRGDVDCFAVTGPGGGTLAVEASGLPDVDLAIDVRVPTGGAPEGAGDAGGPSQAERVSGVAWPAGSPPPVFCVRRKDFGKKGEAPSLATPYFVLANLVR
jgi:hypothetical protein